jgi:hypothetical protein
MDRHVSELEWSQLLGNDLSWWSRRRVRSHQQKCSLCRETYERMLEERSSFDAAPERQEEIERLIRADPGRAAVASRRRSPMLLVGASIALAAAAALVVVLLPGDETLEQQGGGADVLRPKGDLFVLYRERGGEVVSLQGSCQPGDRIRARFATDRGYVLIASRDGAGQVAVLYPRRAGQSAAAPTQAELTPGSWVLDDTPGTERFFAVFSERPLSSERVVQAISSAAPSIEGAVILEAQCQKVAP